MLTSSIQYIKDFYYVKVSMKKAEPSHRVSKGSVMLNSKRIILRILKVFLYISDMKDWHHKLKIEQNLEWHIMKQDS